MELLASSDGITGAPSAAGLTGDRTTCLQPVSPRMGLRLRGESDIGGIGRHRQYWETPDLFANVNWQRKDERGLDGADDADPRRPG
jgi:hypothetical protein